jgi:hypothetical protein
MCFIWRFWILRAVCILITRTLGIIRSQLRLLFTIFVNINSILNSYRLKPANRNLVFNIGLYIVSYIKINSDQRHQGNSPVCNRSTGRNLSPQTNLILYVLMTFLFPKQCLPCNEFRVLDRTRLMGGALDSSAWVSTCKTNQCINEVPLHIHGWRARTCLSYKIVFHDKCGPYCNILYSYFVHGTAFSCIEMYDVVILSVAGTEKYVLWN